MKKLTIVLLMMSFFLAGCAHHGAAYIETQPSGAEVVDAKSGVVLGVTPIKAWWRDDSQLRKFVNIRVQKEGYLDKTSSFWLTLRHKTRESAMQNPQSVELVLEKKQ